MLGFTTFLLYTDFISQKLQTVYGKIKMHRKGFDWQSMNVFTFILFPPWFHQAHKSKVGQQCAKRRRKPLLLTHLALMCYNRKGRKLIHIWLFCLCTFRARSMHFQMTEHNCRPQWDLPPHLLQPHLEWSRFIPAKVSFYPETLFSYVYTFSVLSNLHPKLHQVNRCSKSP